MAKKKPTERVKITGNWEDVATRLLNTPPRKATRKRTTKKKAKR